MADNTSDLERQQSVPTLRDPDEEEYQEEHDPVGYGEKDERSDDSSDHHHHHHRRHSYDYARENSPDALRRVSLSRHTSAYTTLSRLRSRNVADPQNNDTFYHPLSHVKTDKEMLVDFEGKDDPYRPINWPMRKKIVTTMLYGLTTAGITFASSVYSAGLQQVSAEFHVGTEVSSLGISFILFGFGLGPLLWAPLSEVYGRKTAVLIPYFIAAIFSFGSGSSENIQTLLITRFFTGFFGSAPITNTGGVLGDIWSAQQRGMAMVAYALAVTGGPTLGPLIGGAICQSYLGWRWTEYITGILMMAMLTLDVLLLDESFGPVLLTYKARRLRHETGNWALHSSHEEWDFSIRDLARKYLVRPFQLLVTPICFLVALYASFVYAILYSFFSAFPVAFQEVRGWNQVVGALPFLAVLIGILIGAAFNIFNQKYYQKRLEANNNRAVPEARLPPMMGGSIAFAAGLFVFAWTSERSTHWIGQQFGCVLIGIGFFTIFQACLNYLVDTFQKYGASAIGANTFLRSCLAGAFPLFITQELHAIGIDWGLTVFACFAVLLIPVPYIFFFYGKRIRASGKWSRASVTD